MTFALKDVSYIKNISVVFRRVEEWFGVYLVC